MAQYWFKEKCTAERNKTRNTTSDYLLMSRPGKANEEKASLSANGVHLTACQ